MCLGDKKGRLQLSRRELLLLLLQTRCSYSCFCSKALSRHMKVQVVDISRATQVQGAGLPFQLSHVQDYRTTYHSMLTTPSRQIRKTHVFLSLSLHTQGLVSRSYRLHVPKHWPLDNNQPLPLLLDFHGWTQHAG